MAAGGAYWYATNSGRSSGQVLTLGSNASDEVPKRAMQAVVDAFTAKTGIPVQINTTDPNSFQDRISTYLQTTPDDVFTWFAGYRMRFFADQGLASDVSDLWNGFATNYSDGVRFASTASDGREYFVPFITYPWAVIYRRSVWESHGYSRPQTWSALFELCDQMAADGLVPIAYANREGWPAMGTFDILNLRLNGYAFHLGLLRGAQRWTDDRVVNVFMRWKELLPHVQAGAQGRTWQEAARSVIAGEAGMIYLGTYAAEQASEAERDDMDFFEFPLLGTEFDAELALDAPINGFMMSNEPDMGDAARSFLNFVATGEAQNIYVAQNPSRIAVARDATQTQYTALQQRAVEVVAGAARIAQFFDRDTRPDFAGPQGMQSFLSDFLANPGQDIPPLLIRIQAFWDSLP